MTFSDDTKPPAPDAPQDQAGGKNTAEKVDGVVGQLEVYESGAVKMRLANGIVMDVRKAYKTLKLVLKNILRRSLPPHSHHSYNTLSTLTPQKSVCACSARSIAGLLYRQTSIRSCPRWS